MFPQDSQILVDDFRHQNIAIWTFLAWVMVIFLKKKRWFVHLQSKLMILQIFCTKMAITQASKVQIAKFWCLKSSTDIWLSCGNIYSISKINKIEIEGKKVSKPAKNGQFFTLKKLKFSKFSQGLIWQLFLWHPVHQYQLFPLTKPLRHARPGRQPPQAPCSTSHSDLREEYWERELNTLQRHQWKLPD